MVELCELKLMDQNLESQWPPDIDQHIAQLDFQRSSDEDTSLFSSMALEQVDPSIISTDSLDMEKLHARCEVNKNDYKLTFEDSGQWTSGNFTTWGRIKSTEPLEEKTNSLPELGAQRPVTSEPQRPSSLLATFVERQPDYEYSELYMGNGRYVDVNDNEIGFVPQSTAALQHADRWRAATQLPPNPPMKPRRTFADFNQTRAPQLDFMLLNHNMPSLCQSSVSMNEILEKVKEGILEGDKLDFSVLSVLEKRGGGPDSGLGCSASASSGPSHIEDWPSLAVLLPKHVVEACSFFKQNSRLLTGSNNIERKAPRRTEACRTCFSIRRRLHPPIWAQPVSARHVLCDCTTSEIVDRSYLSARERVTPLGRLKIRAQELSIVGLPIYDAKRKLVEKVVEGVAEIACDGLSTSLCTALEELISDGLKENRPWRMIVAVTAPGPATNSIYAVVKKLDSGEKSENSRVSTFFTELLRLGSIDCWMCYIVLKENILVNFYDDDAFILRANTAYRSLLWRLLENLELLTVLKNETKSYENEQKQPVLLSASRLASDSRVPKSSSMPARMSSSRPTTAVVERTTVSTYCPKKTGGAHPLNRRSRIPLLSARPVRAKSSLAYSSASRRSGSSEDEKPSGSGEKSREKAVIEQGSIDCAPKPALSGRKMTIRTISLASAIEDFNEPGMLPVSRGERVRILATRGPLARCCRVRPRYDCVYQGLLPKTNLAINGF